MINEIQSTPRGAWRLLPTGRKALSSRADVGYRVSRPAGAAAEHAAGKLRLPTSETFWHAVSHAHHLDQDQQHVLKALARPGFFWGACKRLVDVLLSACLLVLLSPLWLAVMAGIRLTSKGPVLYFQERVGLNGMRFLLWKFRTMRIDAERETGPVWAVRNDPRRTPLGTLLRRFSIDELPQLVNVLRGDMSLVGPRPERPSFVEQFRDSWPAYEHRHKVRPGLTGWAQLNGLRGNTSLPDRLGYDLAYVARWTLAFDLLIILLTPLRILFDKNAY